MGSTELTVVDRASVDEEPYPVLSEALRIAVGNEDGPSSYPSGEEERFVHDFLYDMTYEDWIDGVDFHAHEIHDAFVEREAEWVEDHPAYENLETFRRTLETLVKEGCLGRHTKSGTFQRDDSGSVEYVEREKTAEYYYTYNLGEAIGKYGNIFSLQQVEEMCADSGMPKLQCLVEILHNRQLSEF
ncbi:hypothetical protein [Haloplanus aerogenes]|uniref:Uncharacterized protein n=1 Tax=Haloplanus aerogenes TaxID=660522 RepID=A0A3M0DQ33_9EURY|nr:hypothetical protein [Haloplanus aerogenes]AZH24640.1 hypothetical protein DU502_04235 [Haloplanus aerogenes]RMB23704.1 hypothetical protein ATH50_0929 [Haloplanus aerogenes]